MKNLNTPEYWDKCFEHEYNLTTTGKCKDPNTVIRLDPLRYEMVGKLIKYNDKILDVGCGLGNFCRFIWGKYPKAEIFGVDFSPFAVEKATELSDFVAEFSGSDAYELPFNNRSFDVVTGLELVEHLSYPEKFIKEAKRILKPGGKLIISTPHKDTEAGELISTEHVKEYEPKELAKILTKCGFGEILFNKARPYYNEDRKMLIKWWWYILCATK